MKDSIINNPETFLSELPEMWSYDRMKDVVSLRNDKTDEKSDEEDYIELEDIDSGTGKLLSKQTTLEVESAVTLFKKGDVLFGKLRPYLEKYYLAEFDGKCTGEILAFKPDRIDGNFLRYCIASPWFIEKCNALAYGAKMPRVNWATQLAVFNIPLPPLDEQRRIASYLDKTCAAIDTAIEKKQKQLETLDALRKAIIHKAVTSGLDDSVELMDSGVEWIGKVPKHWQPFRLKDVAVVNGRALPTTTDADVVLRYLEISNVNNRGIVSEDAIEEIAFIDAPSRARRIVLTGDTLISSVRPNLQAVAHITNVTDNLIASTGFYVVSPNHKRLDPKYTYYFLLSENTKQYLEAVAKGVGYPAVDDKDFTTLKCFLPPIPEQRQIVDYLERNIAVLYDVQKNLTGQITDLEQYRKSLIHECVTGKRRIE